MARFVHYSGGDIPFSAVIDDRSMYYIRSVISGLPIIGTFLQAQDKVRYMDDYMANRGLSYADILYPSMTSGYQGVAGVTNFVSENILRLYR